MADMWDDIHLCGKALLFVSIGLSEVAFEISPSPSKIEAISSFVEDYNI